MGLSVISAPPGAPRAYGALNTAASASAQPVLLFCAAGVTVSPQTIERLSAALSGGVGIAVPSIVDAGNHVVSAGLSVVKTRMSPLCFDVVPRRAGEPFDERAFTEDVIVASAACMAIDRALFAELGGFSEDFLDALADVDLSLRARERGSRIVCVRGAAAMVQSDAADCDDPRRLASAHARLDRRWRDRIEPWIEPVRQEMRETRVAPERYLDLRMPARSIVAFVYGPVADGQAFKDAFLRCGAPVTRVVWTSPSEPPELGVPLIVDRTSTTTTAARATMELRGDRAVAFVNAALPLRDGWLEALGRELAWGADVVAAMLEGQALVALADIPQHLRLDDRLEFDAALAVWLAALQPCGLAVRGAQLAVKREAPTLRAEGLASIIMLSWNAPNYTKLALESIRAHTRHPHEIIIVDNGSGPETTDWLKTLDDVRVIFNEANRGFAGGNNQGLAAARGEYLVVLNNDVIVTEGWLEDFIDALRRNPLTGVTAPRSNRVAGSQMIADADYPDVAAMHHYAAARRSLWRRTGFYVDRAIGFCLCIDRRVVDEIGGIDERFGAGNFEDDDFSMRVRSAGYKIYVCDDVFIHHFGSVTFTANKIDWQASMRENWTKFARKWGLEEQFPVNGYQPQPVIARGFDRVAHYIPLAGNPDAESAVAEAEVQTVVRKPARARFAALVRDESDWSTVGAFVRRFARAFDIGADVTLEIAACGAIDAATLGERVVRLLERNGMDVDRVAEIGIDDVVNVEDWLRGLAPASLVRIQSTTFGGTFDGLALVEETSPSALRRVLAEFETHA